MYAIIRSGGHQYRVSEGDTLSVEKLEAEAGDSISLDEVLMIGGGGSAKSARPLVEGASVGATVLAQEKGDKITVFKYKPKKRYRIKTGHRQRYTKLRIDSIKG